MLKINKEQIFLNQTFETAEEAVRFCGEKLVELGFAQSAYTESMLKRHKKLSVYIGNFVALPHGEGNDHHILEEGIILIQVPDGVNFGDNDLRQMTTIIIAVALKKESQLSILQELAFLGADIQNIRQLSDASTVEEIQAIFNEAVS